MGEGDDGHGRRIIADGGEDRTAGDEKIAHAMHTTIGVNDAFRTVGMHARRAHVMPGPHWPLELRPFVGGNVEPTQSGSREFVLQDLDCLPEAVDGA